MESCFRRKYFCIFLIQTVLDEDTRAVLYANLVTYMDQEDPLYREYQKEISRFGTEQILKGRISRAFIKDL